MTFQDELRALADKLDTNPELAAKLSPYAETSVYLYVEGDEFNKYSKLLGGKRDKRMLNGKKSVRRRVTDHTSIHVISNEVCKKVPTGRIVEERVSLGYRTKMVPEYRWECE